MITLPAKDPNDTIDYALTFIHADGDTTASVTPSAIGCTVDVRSGLVDEVFQLWVSGGTAGVTATVLLDIVTAGGRTFQRSVQIPVAQL